ncbi:MAG TPA: diguanylate cyclase, partial [Nevskiaceae bacterium]|nr:diguanylate cyclase [Nevskiaceae bacterium]
MPTQVHDPLNDGAVGVAQPIMDRSFRELFVRNPLPMWLYDKDSLRFLEVNEAAVRIYGYSRAEFLSMTLADIRPKDDLPRMHNYLRRLHAEPAKPGYHRAPGWRHLRKDGVLMWVDTYSHDFWYGEHLVRLVQVHDVSALKQAAERLAEQSAFFSQLFHNSPEAIVMLDEHDVVVDANAAFEQLFQYTLDEIKGRGINELIVPPEHTEEATGLSRSVFDRSSAQRDTVRQRKDGSLVEVSALGYPITLGSRQVGVFAIYRDITESKRLAADLAFHTSHDPLTGLINRHEFERRAKARMQWGARSRVGHAMLYMDLDQFKVINDGGGHAAGDRLLVEIAELLRAQLRDSDSLARLGGDEFGVLLNSVDLAQAAATAERIVHAVRDLRFKWEGRVFNPGISIGVVALGGDIGTLSELMSAADTACYTAKERGRSRVQI